MRFRPFLLLLAACGSPQTEPGTPQPFPSASVAPPDPPLDKKKPSLAKSTSTNPVPTEGLDVVLTPSEIRVKGVRVAPDKKNGANDLLIVALADAAKKSDEDEALLAIAPDVKYRAVTEVLFTLSQSDVSTFHLLVAGPNGTSSIDSDSLRVPGQPADVVSGPSRRRRPTINLSLFIVTDGISIKTSAANLAPGCNSSGVGLAVPKRDFEALTACVAKAKAASPEFAAEDTATVTANPDTDFQTVIRTIDAIRPSFPKMRFGIAR